MRQATLMTCVGVLLAAAATGLSLGADDAESQATIETDAGAAATVEVSNFEYADSDTGTMVTRIQAGETVEWVWMQGCHSVTHGVRGPGNDPVGPSMFDTGETCATFSDEGEPLTRFTRTFEEPGVYQYYCRPHPQMLGVVVVEAA